MKPISFFEFNRKRFLKVLKSKFNSYIYLCKLYKSDKIKEIKIKFDEIILLINNSFQKKITFDNNNIFLIIDKLDNFENFILEFSESIKNTNNIESLNDRFIFFFNKQEELKIFLSDNLINPKGIELCQKQN